MHTLLQKSFFFTLAFSTLIYANITGTVYTDFNLNGVKDSNDVTLKNVPVSATCEDGNTYNTLTDNNGLYTLSGFPLGEYCRIEADPSSQDLSSSSNSAGSAPLVERVLDGTSSHDISVASSGTYCQENPDVIAAAVPVLTTFNSFTIELPDNYPTLLQIAQPTGNTINGQGTIDNRDIRSYFTDTGATWGLAYKRDTEDTFMAASIKSYANFGSGGVGAIYKVDASNNISLFTTIPYVASTALNAYINDTPRDVVAFYDDDPIYPYMAREGLADIDISEDYKTLYALNMHTKSIVEIDTTSGAILKTTQLPNPYGVSICPSADVRPWALTVKGNNVYVGSICESKVSDGVGASIQKYNGAIVQEVARNNTLDYLRPQYQNPTTEAADKYNFQSWPAAGLEGIGGITPILTDLSFTPNGDLVLAYTNRSAFMRRGGALKYRILGGDIRKMCLNNDGSYTDESTIARPTSCSSNTVTYTGNTDVYNEFYLGDFIGTNYGEDAHPEAVTGALAQAPGVPYVVADMVDGTELDEPGAIVQFSHTTGEKLGTQALLKSSTNNSAEAAVFGGKAGGLGDIELMCDPAPIEVGNYVWVDLNENGIQDPNETPIAGVDVTLWDGNTQIATTTTDSTGHYYFGGITNSDLIKSHHNYIVKIANSQPQITTATTSNPNDPSDDIRDNDAQDTGASLEIAFQTSANNDHSLDFGIVPVKIGNRVWIEDDKDGDASTGNITPVIGTTVTATCNGIDYTGVTDNNGLYEILVPANVTCTVKTDTPCSVMPEIYSNDTTVTDTSSENDKSHDATGTTVSVGKIDNMTLDFGCTEITEVKIGNRVWLEDDSDGDASTGTITPVVGTTVTATCNGIDYTDITDNNGLYEILVPVNVTCTVKTNTPCNIMPEVYSNDTTVTDTSSENDKSHDATGTSVSVSTIDNMTLDFGCTDIPEVFDLALTKELKVNRTYSPGENVTFTLTVYNQGTLDASNIQISDYIPAGLELNDAQWTRIGNTARLNTPIATLAADSSTTVDITFTIDANYNGDSITNNAEIRSAVGGTDVDSTPDSEYGSIPDPQDNDIDNTTGGDDYDPAVITLGASTPTPTPTATATTSPSTPSSLSTSTVTANSALLTWSDNATNESGYRIYQNGTLIATLAANTTSYLVTNLTANTSYTYTVKAFNNSGESSATTVTFSTPIDYSWLPAVYHIILN
ncbi:MAG: Cna B domain protein [uncultured Sulfurovum sp.]|uniref:Cna B domain protein n=1 Tax=uncultured Sulfurovum sp. TaxID=269237 RepID=A0A6S6RW00_9BACT|nr:MAG: Cna B domain protein [uncultured Sulfurovum sp.]